MKKALFIAFVLMIFSFSLFAGQIKYDVNLSYNIEQLNYEKASSTMFETGIDFRLKNRTYYFVSDIKYASCIYQKVFLGIPDSIFVSLGVGRENIINGFLFDSELKIRFMNMGLKAENLNAFFEVSIIPRKHLNAYKGLDANIQIPFTYAFSANGNGLSVGFMLGFSWGN